MGDGSMKGVAAGRRLLCAGAVILLMGLTGCAPGLPEALTVASSETNAELSAAALKKPGPLPEKTLGSPNAPVTIIEYASLGCPICAAFHKSVFPKFKAAYIDTGKVHFIYREFPIGRSAAAAAQVARCVPEKDYFRINDKYLANRRRWNAREPKPELLYKIVQETGLSRAAFDSCMANQKIKAGIDWVKQRGRKFGVKGTPTFFIDGQQVRGALSLEDLRKLIEKHLAVAAKPA